MKIKVSVPLSYQGSKDNPMSIKLGLEEVHNEYKERVKMFSYYNVHAVSLKFMPTANCYGQTFDNGQHSAVATSSRLLCGLFEPNPDMSWDHEGLMNHPRARLWQAHRTKSLYTRLRTPITVKMGNVSVDMKLKKKPLVSTSDINADWGNFWLTKSKDDVVSSNIDPPVLLLFTYYVSVFGFSNYTSTSKIVRKGIESK